MKRFSVPALFITAAVLLGACVNDNSRKQNRPRPGFNPPPANVEETPPVERRHKVVERDREEPAPDPAVVTDHAAVDPGAPPAPRVGNPEYGKKVPGKEGLVTSPYSPGSGYVDVHGFPPGTEVKDPYTGKIFLVP